MSTYRKPLPSLTDDATSQYWERARQHQLVVPRCTACGTVFFYPRLRCPSCWSNDLEWIRAAETGTIWSLTWVHTPFFDDVWADDVPYCVAIVELDEGVRMVSAIVGVSPGDVSIGTQVRAVFDAVTPEVTLPKFELTR
ncbi:MAG: Zn-ribbon domain-containing OB-fold protein [Acidimicrobiales bacterium]